VQVIGKFAREYARPFCFENTYAGNGLHHAISPPAQPLTRKKDPKKNIVVEDRLISIVEVGPYRERSAARDGGGIKPLLSTSPNEKVNTEGFTGSIVSSLSSGHES
jgi:hypothetical protein